jgi:uncharacterized membrane protein required for colicin V production
MPIFDIILVFILAGFVFYGLFFGLIRTIGAFLGVIIGALAASRLYAPVADWIDPIFFGYLNLGKVLVFLILFTLINRLIGFLFYLLDQAFNIISILPFLKTINRLGGMALGFLTGSLAIGLVLYVISKYAILEHWIGKWLSNSEFVPFFLKVNDALMPILPEVLKKLEGVVGL